MAPSQEGLSSNANFSRFQPTFDRELIDNFLTIKITEGRRSKAPKGSVVVAADKGWLRLVWSYAVKRYLMTLGMPDNQTNRAIAETKAGIIYRDIITDNFDPTLEKYKPQTATKIESVSVVGLFEQWLKYKAKQVEKRSLEKQQSFAGHLRQFFKNNNAVLISEDEAFKFRDWLLKRNEPITVRERITWLQSCWEWGIKQKLLVGNNPWNEVKVRVAPT
jgi:integrase